MGQINTFNGVEILLSVKGVKFPATINSIEVTYDGYMTSHAHPSEAYSNTANIFITTAKGTETKLYHYLEEGNDSGFQISTRDGMINCEVFPLSIASSIIKEIHSIKPKRDFTGKIIEDKQTIKLKESQLRQLVTETIKKVLKEQDESDLRYELHTLIGDEMRKEKRADMYGGVAHHVEEYKEAENKVKMFLKQNPSMLIHVDTIQDHFLKQLYQ